MNPLPPLVGHILHRLNLTRRSENKLSYSSAGLCDSQVECFNSVGFFITTRGCDTEDQLLALPQSLLKLACDAVRYHFTVRIWSYHVTRLCESELGAVVLVEVHENGMQLLSQPVASTPPQASTILSLSQFRQIENSKNQLKAPGGFSSSVYSVTAKVDAISPIIAMIPSDPFAMMELYEDDNSFADKPLSTVAVLKGQRALLCHEAIQPGDHITLHKVKRQRWKVPAAFQKSGIPRRLRNRPPSHVLVVDKAESILWSHDSLKNSTTTEKETHGVPPQTCVPLVSFDGAVMSRKFHSLSKSSMRSLSSIEFSSVSGQNHVLFLDFFPLSPSLQLALRPGAVFRAVNVHPVAGIPGGSCQYYGACLRSTLSLLSCSKEHVSCDSSLQTPLVDARTQALCTQAHDDLPRKRRRTTFYHQPVKSYHYAHIKVSSIQQAYRAHLWTYWYRQSGFSDLSPDDTSFPPLDEIVLAILESSSEVTTASERKGRDPYEEFFDHACVYDDILDDEKILGGCEVVGSQHQCLPPVVTLGELRDACVQLLFNRFDNRFVSEDGTRTRAGSTMAIHFSKNTLWREILQSRSVDSCAKLIDTLYVAGVVSSRCKDDKGSISLRESQCQLPITGRQLPTELDNQIFENGDFIIASIEATIVSCLCLGLAPRVSSVKGKKPSMSKGNENGHQETHSPGKRQCMCALPLPPCDLQADAIQSPFPWRPEFTGSCFLFERSGYVFIASVQLRCSLMKRVGEARQSVVTTKATLAKTMMSVGECLSQPSGPSGSKDKASVVCGILCRQRFKLVKVRNESYSGCVLTVAHSPLLQTRVSADDTKKTQAQKSITVQSFELKLSIKAPQSSVVEMRKHLGKLVGSEAGLFESHSSLAVAWWRCAENPQCCAMNAGGYDELVRDKSQARSPQMGIPESSVHVELPISAVSVAARGYVRVACTDRELRSFYLKTPKATPNAVCKPSTDPTEHCYIGGRKFLQGMVDRQVIRRRLHRGPKNADDSVRRLTTGEMVSVTLDSSAGIPLVTLAQLHWIICKDIRNGNKGALNPSLVRCIKNTKMLSVGFCRAQAQCTRCFKALCKKKTEEKCSRRNQINGVVRSTSVSNIKHDNEPATFWHVARPIKRDSSVSTTGTEAMAQKRPELESGKLTSDLVCPNDCPLEYASIKWECSGIIDDGTGQAKLHAEREAALTLLGQGLNVHAIEEGAWKLDGGVVFLKATPPKAYVKHAVLEARSIATQMKLLQGTSRRALLESDVLQVLSVEARAEYLMQRHCRESLEPSRSLHLLCRCIPLADGLHQMNQTQVDCVSTPDIDILMDDVISYTLPPLKLDLVDCVTSERAPPSQLLRRCDTENQ